MSQAYIIEVANNAVGVVVRQQGDTAFHFHSASPHFHALDGRTYDTPLAAERAALAHHARLAGQRAFERAQERIQGVSRAA